VEDHHTDRENVQRANSDKESVEELSKPHHWGRSVCTPTPCAPNQENNALSVENFELYHVVEFEQTAESEVSSE